MDKANVVIIGGGVAGLAAARVLAEKEVLVLERESFVGGRTYSVAAGNGSWFCLGAQYLPPGTQEVAAELGVGMLRGKMPPPALIFRGKRVIESNPVLWFFKVPFSLGGRISFLKVMAKLSRMANRYDRMSETEKKRLQQLPLSEWLGNIHPEMHDLLEMWATFAGGKTIAGVSTYSGLAVVHAALGRPSSHYGSGLFTTAVGGPGAIAREMASRMPEGSLLTGATVTQITQSADSVTVVYEHEGLARTVSAEAAIVTVPSVLLPELIPDLPPKLREASQAVQWSRSLTMGVLIDTVKRAPWNSFYWMRIGGPWIANILNPAYFDTENKHEGSALTILCSGEPADRLWELSDEEATSRIISQLEDIFPEVRGHILSTTLQRWPYAYPATGPATVTAQELLSQPFGRINFAGDYLIRIGTQEAIEAATTVAERVRSELTEGRAGNGSM